MPTRRTALVTASEMALLLRYRHGSDAEKKAWSRQDAIPHGQSPGLVKWWFDVAQHVREQEAAEDAQVIVLRVVCAWCKTVLVEGTPGAPISHGICRACEREHS